MPSGDPKNWNVLERLRASYDRTRSGDLLIIYEPGWDDSINPDRSTGTTTLRKGSMEAASSFIGTTTLSMGRWLRCGVGVASATGIRPA